MQTKKLTDAQVLEIRAAVADGASMSDVAGRFSVSKQHVSRLVRGEQRAAMLPADRVVTMVTDAVSGTLESLGLQPDEDVSAALALTLAMTLDELAASRSTEAAKSVAGVSKELREVLADIRGVADDIDEFVTGIFADVEESALAEV